MLLHEKADQAQALLAETGLACWLTFARETELHPDPGIEQVVGAGVVRNSAFNTSTTNSFKPRDPCHSVNAGLDSCPASFACADPSQILALRGTCIGGPKKPSANDTRNGRSTALARTSCDAMAIGRKSLR